NATVKMTCSTSSQGSLSQDEIGDESFVDESKQADIHMSISPTNLDVMKKSNSFFTENYENLDDQRPENNYNHIVGEHEDDDVEEEQNTEEDDDEEQQQKLERRKSLSARFRSTSKEINSFEHVPVQPPLTKHTRSQIIATEPKTSFKSFNSTRKNRSSRAQSEDRFRSSTVSLCESIPSYAAPTASSKLKANSMSEQPTTATVSSNISFSSSSSSSSTIIHQVRRAPSVVSLQTATDSSSSRPSSAKTLTNNNQSSLDLCKKSRSTQNLSQLLTSSSTTTTIAATCSSSSTTNVREETTTTVKTKPLTLKQIKLQSQQQIRRFKGKRPPNLPTSSTSPPSNPPAQSSSTSSSCTSSPTKNLENLQKEKRPVSPRFFPPPPCPLRELNDQQHQPSTPTNCFSSLDIPKWAKDCLYRTIVLGLSPLVIKDSCPSSSMTEDTITNNSPSVVLTPQIPRSTSICSIESTDSLETTSEAPPYQPAFNNDQNQNDGELRVRRSISIPDYRHLQHQKEDHQYHLRFSSLPITATKFDKNNNKDNNYSSHKEDDDDVSDTDSYNYIDDDRLRNIVGDLHNRLSQLEQLYATVSKSSESRDIMLKNYIEQIFTDLHTRITQQKTSSTIEATTTTSEC
ncbi:unnamed protein product, partial [Didymodactylos carnosus]